jgi:hypothetical protein
VLLQESCLLPKTNLTSSLFNQRRSLYFSYTDHGLQYFEGKYLFHCRRGGGRSSRDLQNGNPPTPPQPRHRILKISGRNAAGLCTQKAAQMRTHPYTTTLNSRLLLQAAVSTSSTSPFPFLGMVIFVRNASSLFYFIL